MFSAQNPWQSEAGEPWRPWGPWDWTQCLGECFVASCCRLPCLPGPSPGPSRWNPTPGTWRCYCRGAQRTGDERRERWEVTWSDMKWRVQEKFGDEHYATMTAWETEENFEIFRESHHFVGNIWAVHVRQPLLFDCERVIQLAFGCSCVSCGRCNWVAQQDGVRS